LRKIALILIVGILFTGCSVTKKNISSEAIIKSENILQDLVSQNLTNNNFFIQKGEIEFVNSGEKQRFLFTMKFQKPGKYLISLRSKTGIEGARIYISGDTILVNDRINKRLYTGNSVYLVKNFGLSQSFLPLLLGDFLTDGKGDKPGENCVGGKLNFDTQVKGLLLNYILDCSKRKTAGVEQKNNFIQNGAEIRYSEYYRVGQILIPKIIEFEENQFNTKLVIKILKVESPWQGSINFIPGKDYEKIELL
jgi:hypothetical protein